METVQETIDKVRNQLNNNIINNLDAISWGNSPEETLAAIQSAPVQEAIMSQAQGSSLVGDTLGAFGIGAGSMLNNTITGGAGLALGNLGRITEAISPFSGWDNDTLTHLANLGMTSAEAYEKSPYRDSWLTSMGKGTLAVHNAIDDALGDLRTQVLGSDPSLLAKGMEGFGSNIGFIIAMALAGSNPLTAALAGGALESISEAGGLLGDAYRKGLYDKGAIGAANKSFLANMALNTALDYALGPFGKATAGIKNPFLRFLTGGIAEQFNELPQETLQQVIEQAAMNSLENGTDFLPELGQGIKQAPEIFMQIAPEVALSTLFGTLARGAGGLATRRGRHNIAKQSVLSRHDTVTNPNGELQLRTHQPDMDFLRQSFADDLTAQKSSLQDIINGIYQSGNEEFDTNPDLIGDFQRHSEKISTIDEQLEAIKNFGRQAEIQNTVDEIQSTLGEQGTEQSNEDLQGTTPEQNTLYNEPVQEVKKPKRGRKKKNTATQVENTQDLSSNTVDEDEDNLPEFTPTEDTVKNYKAKNVAGSNTARITTAARTEVDVRYRIVDADDLVASTTETGAPNPNYLQELQPRQRDKITSLEQIDRIANHLDPEQLGANRMASDGAPVIGSDMMVESGNGRVLGIRKAYKYGKAEHYRDYLRQNAEMFGLTPEEVDKVKNPVLVRERLTDVDRVKFTSEANESSLATMSASENALDDAKKITMSMFNNYDNDKEFEDNEDFIKAVISALPDNERGNLLQADGKISRAGLERVRNAMAAKAYNSDSILRRLSELLDDDVRNISRALVHASPAIAKLESEIENGTKRKDLSLRDDILKAVNQFVNIKKQKKKISDWLAQPALFEEENESPVVRMLMEFFDKNIRAYKRISDGLLRYVELASQQANSGEQVLFEDSIRSKEDMLEEALLHATGEYDEITNTAEKRKKNKTSSENNNVSPTRDDIYNSNFKRFFGDWEKKPQKASKVVDKNGLPLIVYHGTDAKSENGEPPFTEFDTKGTNKGLHGDTTDTGAWFHSSKKAANSYGGYVYQVYLNIRNPYIYDCTGKNPKTIAKKKDQIARDVRAGKYGKGYDGVIFRNIEDVLLYFGFEAGENTKGDVYVVFDKRQVKSATQNNGMYGQATGNIFKQSANPVLAQEEQLRQEFKQKIFDAHRSEEEAEQLSHIYIAANRYFSKYFGIPIDKIIQADNLSIELVPNNEGNRGRTLFYRKKKDIFGNIVQEARTIMQLTNEADRSTILHELGHIFLDKFRRLAASGMLKGRAKQDWQTLVKALKMQGIDFSQELSEADKRILSDAHEEFAVSFEKYLMTGKAPTPKLKHVFETFKRWLTDIYHSIRDIMYEGSDGKLHTFELSPEVREVFDSMLSVDSSADGSVSNDESLISPEDVEQYNQRTYYASGQPLEGDKFDFQKMRQAETFISLLNTGPAWGVTTTQTRFQAKEYRKLNRDFDKQKRIHFRNRGGKDAHEAVRNFKNKEYREAAEWVLLDLERRVDRDTTPEEFDAIKANLLETYQRVHAEEKIHFINQIVRMTVDEDSAGNLYIVDTPDDSLLLDGNLPLAKQPEHVKRAVRGIHEQLKLWGVSLWSGEKIKQSPRQKNLFGDDIEVWNASQMSDVTGIEFYGKLSTAMEKAIGRWQTKITSPKYGEIRNGRMAASIILNRFGVPGLRVKRKGFYTYTTWNEDMLRVLGMSKDSDNDTVRELDRQEEAKKKQQRREQIERSQPSKIAQFLGRERLLQEGEVNINLYGGERGAEPSKHRVTVDTADESYQQIGTKRKKEMDAALTKNRPDMSPEQRAEAISEIEKLGESVRQGGNPKVEKAATHWLLKGHIILPEDNYKIVDAVKICEQEHIDPMSVDDPNEILAKYTIKETKSSINLDSVPEFSNKKTYDNGITVYTVDDTREGQQAVRRIIDAHWGKKANPWCLAARANDSLYAPLPGGKSAWEYWSKTYNTTEKRIAFKNGKLYAFYASDDGKNTWWDKENDSQDELSHVVKSKGITASYKLDEKTGKWWKSDELFPDRSHRHWYKNEQIGQEYLPDGTYRIWFENGQMKREFLSDGTQHEWFEDGKMRYAKIPDKSIYDWYEDGQLHSITFPNGGSYLNERKYIFHDNGHLQSAKIPNGRGRKTIYHWGKRGEICYVTYPDGTGYVWNDNEELITVIYPDGTNYNLDGWGSSTAKLSESELEKLNQEQQRVKQKAEQARTEIEQEIADEIQEAERVAQYKSDYVLDYKPDEPESYRQAALQEYGEWLTPEVNRQLKAMAKKYENRKGLFGYKARNGKYSRLSSTDWLLAHSPAFQKWFGDWENDPEHASKILDENGEPLTVYHGTIKGNKFSIFNTEPQGTHFGTRDAAVERDANMMADDEGLGELKDAQDTVEDYGIEWDEEVAQDFEDYLESLNPAEMYEPEIYPVFLNIRNPIRMEDQGDDWEAAIAEAKRKGHDGIIYKNEVEDFGSDSYVVFSPEQVKSATRNNGEFSENPDIYKQAAYSPRGFIRKIIDKVASTAKKILTPSVNSAPNMDAESLRFANEETERRYRDSLKGVQQLGLLGRIKRSTMGLVQSMKGDFPELSGDAMKFAKEQFRMLQRKKSSQVKQAMQSFTENLRGLDSYQRDLFGRKRLLDDLMWRKKNYPDAELPFGFTEEMLKKEAERFDKLVKSESAVTQAIQREEQTMQSISNEFIALAKDLGLNLEGVLRNPHYYRHTILEYANAAALGMPRSVQKSNASLQDFVDSQLRGITGRGYLKRYKGSTLDISTNYVQANGEVRAQMLMDIEVMKALREIKKKYDIAPKLRQKLQRALRQQTDIETHSQPSTDDQTISDIIPDGYTLYDPAGSRLIQSANSSTENIISMAVDDAARQSGLPLDRLLRSLGSLGEDAINRLLVIPNEIANALDNMSKDRERGMLGNAARVLTNWWKKAVLFSPTRNIKYNFRNFTGDLDALIAGNPKALKFFPQAVRELTAHYRGKNTSQDLQDYIERSGGLNIDSMQITPNEADALQELAETQPASLGKRGWNLVKKFFRNEVAFTAWRENLLRYAAYLSYKQDMEQNNGTPSSWGASIKDEVMSVDDVRDRAYKMSNELLGAYDQISEFGRQLRDLAIPFWSWSEINLKRYYRLLKNGLTGQNSSDFAKRFMLAKSARVPFYAISAAETFAKISLFTMLAQMFNRIVMPDDDDELPPDIKNKPHITLGKVKGQVYYFDRIGALGDAAEWLGLDNIVMDTQQMRRGSMPFAEFMKKVITAPAGKVLQEVNPLFRMPYELATGRTIYPDVSHPRMIRDNGAYISQTFGLSWPYKAATGKPRSDWDEFKNMFVYSADAEEAAYFYSLDMVRQFQERVLGKRFDGFAQTKRGQVLQKLKAALRFNDKNAIKQSLREYAALDGTPQGLKASMKSMNPLYGLDKEEQKKFMRWISQEDRKYLRKANTYYHRLADKYIR